MMVHIKRETLPCACVSHLCLESKRNTVSPCKHHFSSASMPSSLDVHMVSFLDFNGLFVALSHQINPSLLHYIEDTHKHTTLKHYWGDVSYQVVFLLSSRCFEQHFAVFRLPFYPLAPRFPMILLWTPPHAKHPSPLGATSVPLYMVVGLKL